MKLCSCIIAVLVLGQTPAETVTATETETYTCTRDNSKTCTVLSVTAVDPSKDILLPNLSSKTALQIKRGNVTIFTEKLSNQLGDVTKLQLGQLGLRELYLKPELVEVTASGNLIEQVKFKPDGDYGLELLDLNENQLVNLNGFRILVKLRQLQLRSNRIETLDMIEFENLTSLERLDLSQNQLSLVMAPGVVSLPLLEYLSLAGNKLISLNISNWEFESLIELDVSHNQLVSIEGLHDRFGSLQHISIASNPWYCIWLDEVLNNFDKNYVAVKDSDKECEGIRSVNICCLAVHDDNNTYEESFQKLEKLGNEQLRFHKEVDVKIDKLSRSMQEKLTALQTRLNEVEGSEEFVTAPTLGDDLDKVAFESVKDRVQNIRSSLDEEMDRFTERNNENNIAHRKLAITIVELKRALMLEKQKITELQAQFTLLKDNVRSKLEKHVPLFR